MFFLPLSTLLGMNIGQKVSSSYFLDPKLPHLWYLKYAILGRSQSLKHKKQKTTADRTKKTVNIPNHEIDFGYLDVTP